MKAPTALTTWLAMRLTVLMTSGQKSEAPPAPRASPSAATPDTEVSDSSRMPAPATQPPGDECPPGGEAAEQVAAGTAGGGRHQLADDVGAGPEQHARGQVVAQVEHAPGVDTALGDLRQGEHGQEHQQAVPAQASQRVTGPMRAAPPARSRRGQRACPDRSTRAQTPTPSATTAMPGQTQRHEMPAWMTSAAMAAPVRAPVLNRACRRTSDLGLLTRRCDASAFMAVSMEPPATSTRTSTTPKDHVSRVSASTQRRTDQANSAIHRSRRAPTRSQKCAMTALDAPATAMATASSTPSWASLSEKVCWMLNSITAQLPQKRPKVANDATTGPAPASRPCPSVVGGVALRTGPRRPPWRGRWTGRPRPG